MYGIYYIAAFYGPAMWKVEKFMKDRLGKGSSIGGRLWAMLAALVDTHEELLFDKGFELGCMLYCEAGGKFSRFLCCKDGVTGEAVAPAPDLICLLLMPRVGDLRLTSAIYAYHVYILT